MGKLLSKRKVAALLIILVGVVSSIFILSGDNKNNDKATNNSGSDDGSFLSFESLVSEAKTNNTLNPGKSSKKNNSENQNLTDRLASTFASNIAENKNLNISEDQENKLVEQSFSESFSENTFGNEDITVSKNNSNRNKIEYIEKIDGYLNEIAKGFGNETATTTIAKFLEEQNSKPLDHLISNIPVLIDKLLETNVPPSFVEIHIDLLNAWQTKLDIYTAIKNYKEDPLKASIGIKKFEDAVKKQLNAQRKLINTYNDLKNEN